MLAFFFFTLSCKDKDQGDRLVLGEPNARNELRETLADTAIHNVVNKSALLINRKELAISIVEPLLFHTYGETNIKQQQPYECYLIGNYWVISGTLTKGSEGGTCMVIIDGTNSRIVRLTRGK